MILVMENMKVITKINTPIPVNKVFVEYNKNTNQFGAFVSFENDGESDHSYGESPLMALIKLEVELDKLCKY
jgi:hypothetical protein